MLSRRHHADAGEVAKSAERVPAVGVELDRDRASAPAGDGVPVLPGARDAARGRRGEPFVGGGVAVEGRVEARCVFDWDVRNRKRRRSCMRR